MHTYMYVNVHIYCIAIASCTPCAHVHACIRIAHTSVADSAAGHMHAGTRGACRRPLLYNR